VVGLAVSCGLEKGSGVNCLMNDQPPSGLSSTSVDTLLVRLLRDQNPRPGLYARE
jgi:hypothetical protein